MLNLTYFDIVSEFTAEKWRWWNKSHCLFDHALEIFEFFEIIFCQSSICVTLNTQ